MKNKKLYLLLMPVICMLFTFLLAGSVSAEEINEIRITSSTTEVWPGVLPTFQVQTTTEHAALEAFGSNTKWMQWANGMSSWHGFGSDTPIAVKDDSTHYGLDIQVNLDSGYTFGDNVAIYFNNADVTNNGHTGIRKFDWGGYVTIDLGVATNEAGTYRVTYDTLGGSQVQGETVTAGNVATEPINPTKNGYVFAGWYSDSTLNTPFYFNTPINDNVVLFAKWNEKIDTAAATITVPTAGVEPITNLTPVDDTKYTVSLNSWFLDEAGYPELTSPNTYESGKTYTVRFTFYPREGYAFDNSTTFTLNGDNTGCYGSAGDRQYSFTISEAQSTYTVTLDPNNGTSESSAISNLTLNQSVTLGTPESYNFTIPNNKVFAGWMVGGARIQPGESFNVTSDVVAIADWNNAQAQMHTVTFNTNGGSPLAPVNIEHGNLLQEPNPAPVKENATFAGWYEDVSLNVPFNFGNTPINDDIELFAKWDENVPAALEDITFNVTWYNSFVNLKINNVNVMEESQEFGNDSYVYNNVVVPNIGTTDSHETNTLKMQVRFGDYPVESYTVNGVAYTENSPEVSISAEDEWTITVPGAESYTISATGVVGAAVPRTIIWANVDADTTAENYEEDMRLEHGTAKILAIYDQNGTEVAGETDVDQATGMGYAVVNPGDKVLFEFVPEYGYQLTSVKANGLDLEPQDEINQYMFDMPDANIHFQAIFKQTNDVVKSQSDKVKSGTISLADELDAGSAQLTVKDVTLSQDKISGFEAAAGEYEIANYLDIDLYNVFYKGKNDADDVWSDKIDELSNEATITIKLAKGINAEDIVLVHNIHDGDEYEIIPILSYNKKTNTITFKTKSFSNYAIAAKNMVEENSTTSNNTSSTTTKTSSNPRTSDLIYVWVSTLVISIAGLLGKTLYTKKDI